MEVKKAKKPVFDPGLCRCCGTMKKCRLLNYEYEHLGRKETYSEMIMDCFGILVSLPLFSAYNIMLICTFVLGSLELLLKSSGLANLAARWSLLLETK